MHFSSLLIVDVLWLAILASRFVDFPALVDCSLEEKANVIASEMKCFVFITAAEMKLR